MVVSGVVLWVSFFDSLVSFFGALVSVFVSLVSGFVSLVSGFVPLVSLSLPRSVVFSVAESKKKSRVRSMLGVCLPADRAAAGVYRCL